MPNHPSPRKYSESIWKRMVFITVFFTIAPLTLVASVLSLVSISNSQQEKTKQLVLGRVAPSGANLYASLPSSSPSVSGHVISSDARVELIRQFLAKYNSPLETYAQFIVTSSDKYSLDYRLITAIAMKESGLCKAIPPGSHNCWGWGIHSQGTLTFDSYPEAIETVSKGLKENYLDLGYISVEEIMSKYIPHSPGGAWAQGVSTYMLQIK